MFLDCEFKNNDTFEDIIRMIGRHVFWGGRYTDLLQKKFYPDELRKITFLNGKIPM